MRAVTLRSDGAFDDLRREMDRPLMHSSGKMEVSAMQRGVFASVFNRPTLAARFAAVAESGFSSVQLDLRNAGYDLWTAGIPPNAASEILAAARAAGIRIPAVEGTYNMAHPDPEVRRSGHEGLVRILAFAADLDAEFVTLCTGTRSETSMWRFHPDNVLDDAWTDILGSVTSALVVAQSHGISLLVEPEPANIVSSAVRARTLLDQVGDSRLRIVLDPANIVLSDRSRDPLEVLRESFALLGPDIAFAHAKDLSPDDQFCAAGTGIVPWPDYWKLLEGIGYQGDVIFHTLAEADVPTALAISPWASPLA
jgi:sugar phosphate isomerase/epimerase